ncbi:hypothetical protein BY996DRAFT_3504836 [Phakopsora pachyrhizi]|nr:hypothetical protein BY996DRAFT_3504836 [Phakopsora pachyrhizi]
MCYPSPSQPSKLAVEGVAHEPKTEAEAEWVKWLPDQVPLDMKFNRDPSFTRPSLPPYELMPVVIEEIDPLCIPDILDSDFILTPTDNSQHYFQGDGSASMRQIWESLKDWNFPERTDEPRGLIYGPYHPMSIRRAEAEKEAAIAATVDAKPKDDSESDMEEEDEEIYGNEKVDQEETTQKIEAVQQSSECFANSGCETPAYQTSRVKRIIPILRLLCPEFPDENSNETTTTTVALPAGTIAMKRANIRLTHNKRRHETNLYLVERSNKKIFTDDMAKERVLSELTYQVSNQSNSKKTRIRFYFIRFVFFSSF